MNCRPIRLFPFFLLALALLSGCRHTQPRTQSADAAEREKDPSIKTVGDFTGVANANPLQVYGVGLVVGLEGTGGNPLPGTYRNMLEDQLRKRGVENVKELLASPNTSIVLVTATLPPGARKNDPVDVEVSLPPQSRTTSLRGGTLKECVLYNYESTSNLRDSMAKMKGNPNDKNKFQIPNQNLPGHPLVKASGRILVGLGEGDEAARQKQGRIWGGGRSQIDRPFVLVIDQDALATAHIISAEQKSRRFEAAQFSQKVAERINASLHGPCHGVSSELAVPQNNQVVYLRVPDQYKHNLPRFLRVTRLVPLSEKEAASVAYRRRLEQDLLDPKHAVTAALRLEALGTGSVEALKRGLVSDHALVRFSSAEALSYLGCPACGEELARIVEQQPALRAFSLTALASLDEDVCRFKLRELMSTTSPEVRYGAFRALRALDDHDAAVKGELLNQSFWLHRIAPESTPLVHVSRSRRAEVVLFGEDAFLAPPFALVAGDFTVTAEPHDRKCTLSRLSPRGISRRQCGLGLEEVLRTVAALGGNYSTVDELLHQAGSCQCLTCSLAVDALPQATDIRELARNGHQDPDFIRSEEEITKARADLGATPTLFEKSNPRRQRTASTRDDEAELRDRKPKNDKRTVEGWKKAEE